MENKKYATQDESDRNQNPTNDYQSANVMKTRSFNVQAYKKASKNENENENALTYTRYTAGQKSITLHQNYSKSLNFIILISKTWKNR